MQIRYASLHLASSTIIITGLVFYPSTPKLDEIGIKFRSIQRMKDRSLPRYRSNRIGKYSIGRKFRIAITDNRIYDNDSLRKESLSHPIEQTSLCKPVSRRTEAGNDGNVSVRVDPLPSPLLSREQPFPPLANRAGSPVISRVYIYRVRISRATRNDIAGEPSGQFRYFTQRWKASFQRSRSVRLWRDRPRLRNPGRDAG